MFFCKTVTLGSIAEDVWCVVKRCQTHAALALTTVSTRFKTTKQPLRKSAFSSKLQISCIMQRIFPSNLKPYSIQSKQPLECSGTLHDTQTELTERKYFLIHKVH